MRSIALLAHDARSRDELARYLEQAGYQIRIVERPEARDRTLVWLTEEAPASVGDALAGWLAAVTARRAVLVTIRPAAFAELVRGSGGRLTVLPAPVFGWQVVDALGARS